jgi:hypothetical protein
VWESISSSALSDGVQRTPIGRREFSIDVKIITSNVPAGVSGSVS